MSTARFQRSCSRESVRQGIQLAVDDFFRPSWHVKVSPPASFSLPPSISFIRMSLRSWEDISWPYLSAKRRWRSIMWSLSRHFTNEVGLQKNIARDGRWKTIFHHRSKPLLISLNRNSSRDRVQTIACRHHQRAKSLPPSASYSYLLV